MKEKKNILFTSLIYFIIITLFVVVRILSSLNIFNYSSTILGNVAFTVIIQVGLLFLLPFFAYKLYHKKKSKEVLRDLKLRTISSKAIWISIGIGILVFILNIAISAFFSGILSFFGYSGVDSSSSTQATSYPISIFFINIVLVCILPAICEEFTHRGFLLTGYKKIGNKSAIIFSALLFGLLHLNIEQFFYATIIGLILAFITIMSDSIYPAMIVHFINNFINVYLEFARVNKLPFGNSMDILQGFLSQGSALLNMLLIIFSLALVVYLLVFLITCLFSETKVKKLNKVTKSMALKQLKSDFMKDFNIDVETDLTEEEKEFIEILNDNNVKFETKIMDIPSEMYQNKNINIKPVITLPIEKVFNMYTKNSGYKRSWLENLFLYSSIFLGSVITLFTFIWGIL